MPRSVSPSDTSRPSLFEDVPRLSVVHATFAHASAQTFLELLAGYETVRILTYSTSLSLISRVMAKVDDMEIVFGREDILHRVTDYIAYQDVLLRELKQHCLSDEVLRQTIDGGRLRLWIVSGMVSHEKLYLLQGKQGQRVITGSANFSEQAVGGKQNESFICFDNDPLAWDYFCNRYEMIRDRASQSIAKRAILDPNFDIEQLPVFHPAADDKTSPQIIFVEERPPQPNMIHKMIDVRTPKQYSGLAQTLTSEKGIVRLDSVTRQKAVRYVKSHSRTENNNPEEFLTIYHQTGRVVLSGRDLNLNPARDAVSRDARLMIDYFDGYREFRGNTAKLARDYFTFMCWLYISPFICDFRNRAENYTDDEVDKYDYPVFGLLYGKSNCGKSELIRWLLLSMFQRESFLPVDWFTRSQLSGLRQQNRRYPMAFDDVDKTRFANHAIPLIKDDYIGFPEYPAIVLSMNADKDTFETEVRKRCLIIYTGASLPDHTGEGRRLGSQLRRAKRQLGDALYCEYLRRVLERLEGKPPKDILEFSSSILGGILAEHTDHLPAYAQVTTMERYIQTKHDKVKSDLLAIVEHSPNAWRESGGNVVLNLEDIQQIRKLQKDVPDYLIASVSGTKLVFLRAELEEFLGAPIFARGYRNIFAWLGRRRSR